MISHHTFSILLLHLSKFFLYQHYQNADHIIRVPTSAQHDKNAVLFNVDKELIKRLAKDDNLMRDMIVDKKTLRKSRLEKEPNGLYTFPMWIKKKRAPKKVRMKEANAACGMCECEDHSDPFRQAPF